MSISCTTCTKWPYFHFQSKIWRQCRVPRPRFPIRHGNFCDLNTFKKDVGLLIFVWIFKTSWPKMVFLRKWRNEWCNVKPPTNLFLLLGVFTSVPVLVKKLIKKRDRESARRRTDTLTHTQTKIGFVICPVLYAIAMRQIIMVCQADHFPFSLHRTWHFGSATENDWNCFS